MKSDFEKKLKNKAFEYGKKQIEERCFSLAIVNSEFKKMIDTYKITQESKVFSKLNKAFLEGQKFAMQSKYKEALKDLPEEIIKKYGNSINYNINEEEFDNFYELDSKLQLIKKIPEIENIKSGIKPTDADLKAYFEKNSLKYDTFPSAQADIAIVKIEPSSEDKAKAKAEAEEILKTLTSENFKEKAKELSQGPSAGNGGELGWFSKGDMVEPFQKAVFEGEVGKVYPTPVETVFGYHLILIEDRNDKEAKAKASHILITPKVSEATISSKDKEIEELKNKLASKEITFENIGKGRADIVQTNKFKINNAGYISGLGYNENLAKYILDAPKDKIESITLDEKVYIFNKTEDIKYKKAKFEEVKDSVREDYINSKAQEDMKKYI